jgi:hypothetical protein
MVPHAFCIKPGGAAFHSHFPYQPSLHQVTQIVVSCGSRGSGIHAIYGFEDLGRRGMLIAFQQECHHGVTLRRTAQTTALQRLFNRRDAHENLEYI